ncbi:type 1 glutamine amidotransferase-like domain-containing protein [Herbidospora sp. NEAU-GS84]|uniref:Type 1 glutamine amidotransferase-like domain-containing protein n=1 Tax=Herbidospora solisilvae TaxID=2696284 RepID=A0A7C9N1A7_9ACTN|nr:peptidase E [Herbidospora solisilvae]NAS22849.1 type 1 glutamine amidotransferase-like domain-containing protein [Herbidospora solisilvae]
MGRSGQSHIVAIGGGSFRQTERFGTMEATGLLRYVLDLTGVDRPRLGLIATAVGDSSEWLLKMYEAFRSFDVDLSHLALFPMPNVDDPREWLLEQDAVYVSGGSVANLMALWRLHGLDEAMTEAWESGVVLSGQSAGALCWHVGGNTDSFGPELRPWAEGLGLLPYSCGVHYNSDVQRRDLLQRSVASGELPDGYAADEGVALHYVGTEFIQAVTVDPNGYAYRIERDGEEGVKEFRIEPRRLASTVDV